MKHEKHSRRGSTSVEVVMSVAVFVTIALVGFWMLADVYSAIYQIIGIACDTGLSTLTSGDFTCIF